MKMNERVKEDKPNLVFFVDDERVMRMMGKRALGCVSNIEISLFENGQSTLDALRNVAKEDIERVILMTDYVMAEMFGDVLVRKAIDFGVLPDNITFISGNDSNAIKSAMKDIGNRIRIISKPFELNELINFVESIKLNSLVIPHEKPEQESAPTEIPEFKRAGGE